MASKLEKLAKHLLETLGKEDLLFAHYGGVHARPKAYARAAAILRKVGYDEKVVAPTKSNDASWSMVVDGHVFRSTDPEWPWSVYCDELGVTLYFYECSWKAEDDNGVGELGAGPIEALRALLATFRELASSERVRHGGHGSA